MQVFKFGGASVRNAQAIENVGRMLLRFPGPKVVVISAIGKTTNALEQVVSLHAAANPSWKEALWALWEKHEEIIDQLFSKDGHKCKTAVKERFMHCETFLQETTSSSYPFVYDQVVSLGELASTTLIHHYLGLKNISHTWCDARELIRTDNGYTDAAIQWAETTEQIKQKWAKRESEILLTQGFIGGTKEGFTTTLGREGSDFTAAIFAYCLQADNLCVWKDVPGVLSADPKRIPTATLLPIVSYREAIEMTYYGAKVIHPRTLRPLEQAGIPMLVRSFLNPDATGTRIGKEEPQAGYPPIVVYKENQRLILCQTRDMSFMSEDNLARITGAFAKERVRVNMMQTRAVKLSLVVDNVRIEKIDRVLAALHDNFTLRSFEPLHLLTIRHYNEEAIETYSAPAKQRLIEQKTTSTYQVLYKV